MVMTNFAKNKFYIMIGITFLFHGGGWGGGGGANEWCLPLPITYSGLKIARKT